MLKIEFSNLVNTCMACPSQWEADVMGGPISGDTIKLYIRYRSGRLRVDLVGNYYVLDACFLDRHITILSKTLIDDGYDGYLGDEEMLEHLAKEGFVLVE